MESKQKIMVMEYFLKRCSELKVYEDEVMKISRSDIKAAQELGIPEREVNELLEPKRMMDFRIYIVTQDGPLHVYM